MQSSSNLFNLGGRYADVISLFATKKFQSTQKLDEIS